MAELHCQRLIQVWLRSRLRRNANTDQAYERRVFVGSGRIDQLEAGEHWYVQGTTYTIYRVIRNDTYYDLIGG